MRARHAIVVLVAAFLLSLPCAAYAASPQPETYNLNWTLPTAGKSGCMVCHGDPGLQQTSDETTSSLYVDQAALDESAHPEALCTGCHVDFALKTPHENATDSYEWKTVANRSCQSCKDHVGQKDEINGGAHSPVLPPNVSAAQEAAVREAEGKPTEIPTCGGCHGGHAIASKEDTAAQVAVQKSGFEICGECHTNTAATYSDYYHGAAYREGAPWDAPACWDCHGAHLVLPASDKASPVHPDNLIETCGQEGCHKDVNADFVEYAELIHGKQAALEQNPLWAFYDSAKQGISAALENIAALFQ